MQSVVEQCQPGSRGAAGTGLGRLLFYQLFGSLKRGGLGLVKLEAEEDVSRHNRLVRFYESLGFRLKEGARVLYLNNYDEYYRRVGDHGPVADEAGV
jgi:ribosomal protein S18 acetylase RimI-like enzyme